MHRLEAVYLGKFIWLKSEEERKKKEEEERKKAEAEEGAGWAIKLISEWFIILFFQNINKDYKIS